MSDPVSDWLSVLLWRVAWSCCKCSTNLSGSVSQSFSPSSWLVAWSLLERMARSFKLCSNKLSSKMSHPVSDRICGPYEEGGHSPVVRAIITFLVECLTLPLNGCVVPLGRMAWFCTCVVINCLVECLTLYLTGCVAPMSRVAWSWISQGEDTGTSRLSPNCIPTFLMILFLLLLYIHRYVCWGVVHNFEPFWKWRKLRQTLKEV